MNIRAPRCLWYLWVISKDLAFLCLCFVIGRMIYQTAHALMMQWGLL